MLRRQGNGTRYPNFCNGHVILPTSVHARKTRRRRHHRRRRGRRRSTRHLRSRRRADTRYKGGRTRKSALAFNQVVYQYITIRQQRIYRAKRARRARGYVNNTRASQTAQRVRASNFFSRPLFRRAKRTKKKIRTTRLLSGNTKRQLIMNSSNRNLRNHETGQRDTTTIRRTTRAIHPLNLNNRLPPNVRVRRARTTILPLVTNIRNLRHDIRTKLKRLRYLYRLVNSCKVTTNGGRNLCNNGSLFLIRKFSLLHSKQIQHVIDSPQSSDTVHPPHADSDDTEGMTALILQL